MKYSTLRWLVKYVKNSCLEQEFLHFGRVLDKRWQQTLLKISSDQVAETEQYFPCPQDIIVQNRINHHLRGPIMNIKSISPLQGPLDSFKIHQFKDPLHP